VLGTGLFDWQRVRSIEIEQSPEGETPPALMADGEAGPPRLDGDGD
jgi:hypothetical protein